MPLNFYVSFLSGTTHASMTDAADFEEAARYVAETGSDKEEVIGFLSVEGETADALSALARVNGEYEGSIRQTLEKLVVKAFHSHKAKGAKARQERMLLNQQQQ